MAIDLCCGDGGWTDGLLANGWKVRGYDLKRYPNYRGELVLADILSLTADDLSCADAIVASTPCDEFAMWQMRHFHPDPPYPELGIRLFEHVRGICEQSGRPYVMENVRAAQQFVGPAITHAGSFFLWGNAVPALVPVGKFTKASWYRRPGKPGNFAKELLLPRPERKMLLSRIPFELADYIGSHLARIADEHGNIVFDAVKDNCQ